MQKYLMIVCALACCATASSQHSISGTIRNSDQQPLAGAVILLSDQTLLTDNKGEFQIAGIAPGVQKISVSHLGYRPLDTIVHLRASLRLDLVLTQDMDALQEVTVLQKPNTLNTSVAEQKIKAAAIDKYSSQTLGDVLKEVPGVSSRKTGSTIVKPVINGLYGSRVPVISNNVRLEDQEWGTEHAPNFDINAAGRITVIKGASGLQYGGDAIGGLVIIEPVSVRKDTLYGKTLLSLSSNGRGGTISSSLHRGNDRGWSWNVLGTFKYLGDRQGPDYILSNTGNRESNFSGDLKYTAESYDLAASYSYYDATIGILSAAHVGNATDLYHSIISQRPYVVDDFTYDINNPKQDVQHQLAKVNYNRYFSDDGTLSLQYAFQNNHRLEYDLRRANFNDRPALDLTLTTHSGQAAYKKKIGDVGVKAGINGSWQNNQANPETGISPLIPDYQKLDAGLYSITDYDLGNRLTVEAGIRYDFSNISAKKYYQKSRWTQMGYDQVFDHFIIGEEAGNWLVKPEYTFHNLSASLGLHKEFDKELNWYFNLSLASRNPNPSEFFSDGLHHSTGQIELGSLALNKEKSYKVATTLQKNWTSFSIELNPYLNYVNDFIFLAPDSFETTIRGTYPVWKFGQTDARLFGFDMHTHWHISDKWEHHFALAYVNGHDVSNDQPLIDMPPLTFNNKIRYENDGWRGLAIELKHEVVCYQDRYPMNDFETNIVVDGDLQPVTVPVSRPPAAYSLWEFYSEMTVRSWTKGSAVIAFSVQNIFDTNYRDYLNRQRFFAQETGRNFQLQLKINY
jgi:iron complex outermembrane receptor protein